MQMECPQSFRAISYQKRGITACVRDTTPDKIQLESTNMLSYTVAGMASCADDDMNECYLAN